MTSMINASDDLLVKKLPAIKNNKDEYLLFSPYKKTFVKLNNRQIYDSEIIESLEKTGFFDFPCYEGNKDFTRLVLTVTKKCNLFCKYCFAESGPNQNQKMSSKTAIGVIQNISKKRIVERVHFTVLLKQLILNVLQPFK
jgi:sulfatase maturation enzyme AslB (radical SAM superfamily)